MAVLDETFVPSKNDSEKAKAFTRTLARQMTPESRVTIQREGDGEAIEIPRTVFNVLMKVLSVMSEGKPFTLIPMDEELTTQQAADILNVSRPSILHQYVKLKQAPCKLCLSTKFEVHFEQRLPGPPYCHTHRPLVSATDWWRRWVVT
ncbi:MAG: hypothetical protein Q8M16_20020 [Pirellulaceae bacterium]|nr:hypothetical protein [Pirellulaceae bacterium]